MQAISQKFDNSRGDLSDFLDIYQTSDYNEITANLKRDETKRNACIHLRSRVMALGTPPEPPKLALFRVPNQLCKSLLTNFREI